MIVASDRRSKFESKKAPAFEFWFVLLATSPSKTSKAPVQKKMNGPIHPHHIEKCNPPTPIYIAERREHKKPKNESMFGEILCLIKNLTGLSMNLNRNLL